MDGRIRDGVYFYSIYQVWIPLPSTTAYLLLSTIHSSCWRHLVIQIKERSSSFLSHFTFALYSFFFILFSSSRLLSISSPSQFPLHCFSISQRGTVVERDGHVLLDVRMLSSL